MAVLSRTSCFLIAVACLLKGGVEGATVSSIGSIDALAALKHECVRDCSLSEDSKVEWYSTMSKACYDCPFNFSDCERSHCVPTDGNERPIVTINRMLPGPTIQVCAGDEIVVDVENDLNSDTTSIHWHGLHMRGTPYMDGVPMLTQCPINSYSKFRYHFVADPPGTHYWHSHSGFQRTDGAFGTLVIRAPKDPLSKYYDIDDPSHVLLVTDWMDRLGVDKFVNHHHTEHDNKPYQILINGRGFFRPFVKSHKYFYTPLHELILTPGKKHRIRMISNSIQNCPMQVSVDSHPLLVIASDGQPIQPVQVQSLVIYGGERWDFVLEANKELKSYWMKVRGLLDCDDRFNSAFQLAVVRYAGSADGLLSLENMDYDSTWRAGLQLNTLNAAPGNKSYLLVSEIESLYSMNISGSPDYNFWLDFDFYSKDNDLFHHKDYYPFFGVNQARRLYVPQINDISLKFPHSPPLSQPEDIADYHFCNASTHPNCKDKFCHCTHTLNIKKGSLVELILVDIGVVYWANHPFHLHGNIFAVVAMGRLGENTTLDAVKKLDEDGNIERNLVNPPWKDSVTVPDGGYTVIRFVANNPGYWLFHCHITFHVEVGMGLIFRVGESDQFAPIPKDFPKCGNWTPEPEPHLRERISKWLMSQGDSIHTLGFDLLPEEEEEKADGIGRDKTVSEVYTTKDSRDTPSRVSLVSTSLGIHLEGSAMTLCTVILAHLSLLTCFIA